MAILTNEEKRSCFKDGVRFGDVSHKVLHKLNQFQASMVDPDHVAKVNNLIQFAESYAEENCGNNDNYSTLFHARMNELTKRAGLRR